MLARRDLGNAGLLSAANLAGMALPLIALPLLAQRIGPHGFGLVALAQSIGMLPVLLVDAGFNTESMRVTGETGGIAPLQPLLDNLLARLRLALPAALLTLLGSLAIPGLPGAFAAISLLQLLGTLLFPQWWLIATGGALQLFAMQTTGRLLALLGVFAWVRTPDDALLAAALQCGGTLLSGLLFVLWRILPRIGELPALDWQAHRRLGARALPAVGSGFVVVLSTQAPQLVLGAAVGAQQVGLYASGEKIARAAAYAVGAIDQTFIAPIARQHTADPARSQAAANRVVLMLLLAGALIGAGIAWASAPLANLLFGKAFASTSGLLTIFGAWLPSFVARRAYLNLAFAAQGRLALYGRCQYAEAVAVVALCALGAALAGALGAASGLLAAEACTWCAIVFIQHAHRRTP